MRSIVRQPIRELPSIPQSRADGDSQIPDLSPIPVPEGFDRVKRWNPGLLNEEDLTADRAIHSELRKLAGQGKAIQWASFEEPRAANGRENGLRKIDSANLDQSRLTPSTQAPSQHLMRPAVDRYDSDGWQTAR